MARQENMLRWGQARGNCKNLRGCQVFMYKSSRYAWLVLALLVVFGLDSSLVAQSTSTGALTGTVTDASGAVVPNVTVTVTSADTGQVRTTTTSANGSYNVGLLPPGSYRVRFDAPGFKEAEVPSATIVVTETETLNQSLQVGAQSEEGDGRGGSGDGANVERDGRHGDDLADRDIPALDHAKLHESFRTLRRGTSGRV